MLEPSDVNDNAILGETSVLRDPTKPGKVCFSIALPSGRLVTSDWLPEGESGKYVLKWCNLIRDSVAGDIAEDRARRRRESSESAPEIPARPVPVKKVTMSPEEMVSYEYHEALRKAGELEERIAKDTVLLGAVTAQMKKWGRIAQALGLELEGGHAIVDGDSDDVPAADEPSAG